MRNLSSAWKEKVKNGTDVRYLKYVDITLKDGTEISLTNADLWQDGFSFEDAVSSDNSFDIGSTIINTLTISINDFEKKYADYDFEGAEVVCYIGLEKDDGTTEKIRICTMTVVDQPDTETITLDLTCEDNMRKFDKAYKLSTLQYPATRKQILQDACQVCGVTLQSQSFEYEDYIVTLKPEDENLTFRQILAWTAQIGCQWLKCDEYGRLSVGWYDIEREKPVEIETSYTFTPKHTDVVITGVTVTEYSENTEEEPMSYTSGTTGYVIDVSENKLIGVDDGQTVASMIGQKCVGMLFRPFECECPTDVSIEAGDAVVIKDRNGNLYNSYVTTTTLQPGRGQRVACNAKSAEKNSSTRYSKLNQVLLTSRKMVQQEKSEREKALEDFNKRLENSTGVYTTIETQADGSKIYYLHDKPKLSESLMVWKMTAEAWSVSTDGGKTWNGGMTVDGDTIVRILTATGVNADWINAGAITVKDDSGNIIFNVDMDTKRVIISGDHVQIGGKTATTAIDDAVSEAKNYSDEKLSDYADTVSKSISGLQNQIDGQVETFFYDYEPTLQNIPASEWNTTAEREKHEGDLFFWKSTGYAYRFTKDGATWKWQVVQDTDITKALAAAENAQETANNKRRVFVVQPTPPYDIGDLWTQEGGDILTCTTARGKGASYVSSDWKKLNKYTDDTVANEALNAATLARNMTMQLTNDYQSITTDADGNIVGSFPTVVTRAIVMYGTSDITNDCTYTITKSDNLTGTWDLATHSYTVTGITVDDAWVDIRATYLSNLSVTKRFTVVKLKAGKNGENGQNGKDGQDGQNGKDGKDGIGIASTTIYYQIGESQTVPPTGTWEENPQRTTTDKPFLWTKTVWTDTDGKETESYSVSSTMDSLQIGARNLLRNSKTLIFADYYFDNGVAKIGSAVIGSAKVG